MSKKQSNPPPPSRDCRPRPSALPKKVGDERAALIQAEMKVLKRMDKHQLRYFNDYIMNYSDCPGSRIPDQYEAFLEGWDCAMLYAYHERSGNA